MKIGKTLGVSSILMGAALFCTWVNNEARLEQDRKELWNSYLNDSQDKVKMANDTLQNDSLKIQCCAEKAYFEGSRAVANGGKFDFKSKNLL